MRKNAKCKLLPYKRIDCVSVQDAQQKAGWGVSAFNLPGVWQKTQGDGVVIAVLDTGVDLDHDDLKANLVDGINLVSRGKPPVDESDHGTHVTGVLVAENNAIGMVGVAPRAKVMPVKVLDRNGNGEMPVVAEGIRWAADHGADFIVMSLGCPSKLQTVRKAIQYAQAKGTVSFAAAGNAGLTQEIFYPANYKETISIGAIGETFNRASFSCTGTNLDFLAPGVDIFSTVPKNWYATMSGSSMACPFAAGVAALLLSYVRQTGLPVPLGTAEAYRNVFRRHTIPIVDLVPGDRRLYEGFGIIDPSKVLDGD